MRTITIDLPGYLLNKLREKAKAANLSLNEYVALRLSEFAFFELNAEAAKEKTETERSENKESGVETPSPVEARLKSFGV